MLLFDNYSVDAQELSDSYQFIIDSINSSEYNEVLSLFNEKSVLKSKNESYIFVRKAYLLNHHNPLFIKIERQEDNKFILLYKYQNKKRGLVNSDTITINFEKWNIFKNKIDTVNFWNIKDVDNPNMIVFDASSWFVEGKNNELYNFIISLYMKESIIKELCNYVIFLTKLKLNKDEIY